MGAPSDAPAGAVLVFDAATGQEVTVLRPADLQVADKFGYSVALRGPYALVGCPNADDNGLNFGVVYLFDTASGAQLARLLSTVGHPGDQFGSSVALSGTTTVVGAPKEDAVVGNSGAVYPFDLSTGQQLARLLPDDPAASDEFGFQVAISGPTVIAGAHLDDSQGSASGSAYVFDAPSGTQTHKLMPLDGQVGGRFGNSVAIHGTDALIGAMGADIHAGAAYLFDTTSGQQTCRFVPDDVPLARAFGSSVAIGGGRALVGAEEDTEQVFESGAAYVFDLPGYQGASYCGPAAPNSSGHPGLAYAYGSSSVQDNMLTVGGVQLPIYRLAMLINSTIQGQVIPPGAGGTLCLGGAIGRYKNDIQFTGVLGIALFPLDLSATPTPSGLTAVLPGQTWNFQVWFRDFVGGNHVSNFTDAVSITFD